MKQIKRASVVPWRGEESWSDVLSVLLKMMCVLFQHLLNDVLLGGVGSKRVCITVCRGEDCFLNTLQQALIRRYLPCLTLIQL